MLFDKDCVSVWLITSNKTSCKLYWAGLDITGKAFQLMVIIFLNESHTYWTVFGNRNVANKIKTMYPLPWGLDQCFGLGFNFSNKIKLPFIIQSKIVLLLLFNIFLHCFHYSSTCNLVLSSRFIYRLVYYLAPCLPKAIRYQSLWISVFRAWQQICALPRYDDAQAGEVMLLNK